MDFLWIYFAATSVGFGFSAIAPREGENVTLTAREGDNVTLPCRLDTDMNLERNVFDWKKGTQEVFFYVKGKTYNNGLEGQDAQFKDRVGLPPGGLLAGDASVILSNLRKEDGGMYTCFFPQLHVRKWINLIVVVKPQLRLRIEEAPPFSGWVLLSCVSRGGLPQPSGLEWRNEDQAVIPAEPPAASPDIGDPSVIAQKVKVTTPGCYTCTALQDGVHPAVSDDIQVFVVKPQLRLRIEEAPPSSGWVLLSCVSRGGLPQPSGLEWRNEDQAVIPAEPPAASPDIGDPSVIAQKVKVTTPGCYTCTALQDGVHPAVSDDIQVFVVKPQLRLRIEEAPPSSGWVLLSCVSRGGLPQPRLEWRNNQDQAVIPAERPATSPDIGDPSVMAQKVKVTTPGCYTCTALQDGVHPAVSDDIQVIGNWQPTTHILFWVGIGLITVVGIIIFFYPRFNRIVESSST